MHCLRAYKGCSPRTPHLTLIRFILKLCAESEEVQSCAPCRGRLCERRAGGTLQSRSCCQHTGCMRHTPGYIASRSAESEPAHKIHTCCLSTPCTITHLSTPNTWSFTGWQCRHPTSILHDSSDSSRVHACIFGRADLWDEVEAGHMASGGVDGGVGDPQSASRMHPSAAGGALQQAALHRAQHTARSPPWSCSPKWH